MIDQKPNYFAVVPYKILNNKKLPDGAKTLYGILTSLATKFGYAFPTNAYLAKIHGVSSRTVCTWISRLAKYGYINVQLIYKKDSKQVEERRIYIKNDIFDNELAIEDNFDTGNDECFVTPHEENFADNNKKTIYKSCRRRDDSTTDSNVVLDTTEDVTTYHAVKTGTTTAALRENAEERANANDATVSNGQSMQEPPPLTAAPPPITNDPEKRRYIYFCELYEKTYCRTLNSIEQRTAEKYLRFRKPSKKLMHEAIKAKNRIDWIIDYMGRKDKDDMANTPANLKEHSK